MVRPKGSIAKAERAGMMRPWSCADSPVPPWPSCCSVSPVQPHVQEGGNGNAARHVVHGLRTEVWGQQKQSNDPRNNQHNPQYANYWAPLTAPIRQLLGAADAQTAHPAATSTAPAHQQRGSTNAETTPAGAPAAAADRKQRRDAICEGENG